MTRVDVFDELRAATVHATAYSPHSAPGSESARYSVARVSKRLYPLEGKVRSPLMRFHWHNDRICDFFHGESFASEAGFNHTMNSMGISSVAMRSANSPPRLLH